MRVETRSFFLPRSPGEMDEDGLWRWFQNIERELAVLPLTERQKSSFRDYYEEAGLLRAWRCPFFRHHYAIPLSIAVREMFSTGNAPRILDLGCGTGTQSLLFALLGARVVAVDMDETALEVLRKRKVLYEEQSGGTLDISVYCGNVFELDFAALGPFDAVYSLFAFNMMQPSSDLLSRLGPHLTERAVIAIQDGNRSHFFNRLFRPRKTVASKDELGVLLREIGFDHVRHVGGYAIPPLFWRILPPRALEPLDRACARSELLAVSYLHLAKQRN